MNRKEAIERIQELVATEEINKCLKILRQPITLANFLGWEEDVEYENWDFRYKIIDDELYLFRHGLNKWEKSEYNDDFDSFKQAKKIQPKKYYLKLKDKYCNFYGISIDFDYLNFNKKLILFLFLIYHLLMNIKHNSR